MKNKHIILILTLLTSSLMHGQSKYDSLLTEFYYTDNDSLFITRYSKEPYKKNVAERYELSHAFDIVDSVVFYNYNKGDIIGPYALDSTVFFIKVTGVDSSLRMRVGNIYLDPKIQRKDKIENLAQKILKAAQKGNKFDELCKKYKDDANKNYDCDLGWFFEEAMVSEFAEEVRKHSKGEYFIVTTRFGTHIVKVIENPILDRNRVEYVFIYLEKK